MGKLRDFVWNFGGQHLRIRHICMEFGRPLTGHSLINTQSYLSGDGFHFFVWRNLENV